MPVPAEPDLWHGAARDDECRLLLVVALRMILLWISDWLLLASSAQPECTPPVAHVHIIGQGVEFQINFLR
jgi:hypothetical protein